MKKTIPSQLKKLVPCYFYKFLGVKFRIRKLAFRGGWISEYQVKTFWGKKWVALNTYAGSTNPYPSKTIQDAKEAIIRELTISIR